MADSLLTEIIGDPLEAVTFTLFGVKLDFGDAWFTVHGWLSAVIGAETWSFGDRGYRDALCAFISQPVTAVDDSRDLGIVLNFALGRVITRPQPDDVDGPEVAQLAIYDPMYEQSHLAVWRAGEGTFSGPGWD
jgi:hypothetical protein